MKKFIFSLVLAFIMLSFTSNVYSDCPDGFSPGVITISVNGCDYSVSYCWKCITPALTMCTEVDKFVKVNPQCIQSWSADAVLAAIYDYIEANYIIMDSCAEGLPPCNEVDRSVVSYRYSKCWYKSNVSGNIIYNNCHGCDCIQLVEYCWDPVLEIMVVTNSGSPYWDCTTDCTNSEPANPDRGQSTGCFYLHTPCDD